MVVERLRNTAGTLANGTGMKRSLFFQIVIRAALACALLSTVTLLIRDVWVAIGLWLGGTLLLAASIVRVTRKDDPAIETAILSLGEGRDFELKPAFSDHDRLAVT